MAMAMILFCQFCYCCSSLILLVQIHTMHNTHLQVTSWKNAMHNAQWHNAHHCQCTISKLLLPKHLDGCRMTVLSHPGNAQFTWNNCGLVAGLVFRTSGTPAPESRPSDPAKDGQLGAEGRRWRGRYKTIRSSWCSWWVEPASDGAGTPTSEPPPEPLPGKDDAGTMVVTSLAACPFKPALQSPSLLAASGMCGLSGSMDLVKCQVLRTARQLPRKTNLEVW